MRVQRAMLQGCTLPGVLANVRLAGEARLEAKLHRPPARTGATVAGHLVFGTPPIMPLKQTTANGEETGEAPAGSTRGGSPKRPRFYVAKNVGLMASGTPTWPLWSR